jgi:hypothetical protein
VDSDADDDSDLADRAPDTDGSDTATDPAADEDDVQPAAVTYRWDPDGVPCSECGSTADRLWSGESGQVCAACKEW